jgi:hypothetical protein
MDRLFDICRTAFSIVTVVFGSVSVAMLTYFFRSPEVEKPEYRAKFWIIVSVVAGTAFSWIYDSMIPTMIAAIVIAIICATPWARR